MYKNFVEPGRRQMTIWCMRIACWILKATNTHSKYVILTAFPVQQWLQERTSLLRHTCIAWLVKSDGGNLIRTRGRGLAYHKASASRKHNTIIWQMCVHASSQFRTHDPIFRAAEEAARPLLHGCCVWWASWLVAIVSLSLSLILCVGLQQVRHISWHAAAALLCVGPRDAGEAFVFVRDWRRRNVRVCAWLRIEFSVVLVAAPTTSTRHVTPFLTVRLLCLCSIGCWPSHCILYCP